MVETALRAAGHRTGRYTSPHLLDVSERFAIDGRPVQRPALEAAAADLHAAAGRLVARGRLQAPPTFFEATTAIAFDIFRRAGVAVAVCEVGMGGRLDATNVLQPVATAITTIGFDHQQYLGHTLPDIAGEKAGIIKRGVPVIIGRLEPSARAVIEAVAADLAAPVMAAADDTNVQSPGSDLPSAPDGRSTDVGSAFRRIPDAGSAFRRIHLRTPTREYRDVALALAGDHQIANAVVAVRLLEELDRRGVSVPPHAIVQGLEQVVWPGRLESRRLADGREALLDAAHNADGAAALRAHLAAEGSPRPIVFAAMRDKDAALMIETLATVASAFVMTRASNKRSTDPTELAEIARRAAPAVRVLVEPAAGAALASAWRQSPRIVVAGSIFLVADVMNELNRS
jgi:dihydrofolate synthase/folylpolyglutamate synthase